MLILAGYFLVWVIALRVRKVPLLRFDSVVTMVWSASIALNLFRPLVARSILSLVTIALVIGSHAALMSGFRVGGGQYPVLRWQGAARRRSGAMTVLVVASGSLVGVTTASALQAGRIPVLETFGLVQSARLEVLEGTVEFTPLEAAAQTLKYPAVVFVALVPWFIRRRQPAMVGLAVATVLALVEAGFRLGGRADLVFVAFAVAAAGVIVFGLSLTRGVVLAGAGVGVFLFLGSSFLLARNSDFEANQRYFITRSCPIDDPGPWLSGQGTPEQGALALSLCYFASPLHSLDEFLTRPDPARSYRFGSYNAGIVTRGSFQDARREIADSYRVDGLATNPWATSVRDFWLDFGWLCPLAFLPLGYIAARFSRSIGNDELAVARAALLVPCAVMIPFISPLIAPSLVYPLIVVGLLHLLTRLGFLRRSRQLPSKRAPTPGHQRPRALPG